MSLRLLLVRDWPVNRALITRALATSPSNQSSYHSNHVVQPSYHSNNACFRDNRQIRSICTRSLFPRCAKSAPVSPKKDRARVPSNDNVRAVSSYHSEIEDQEHEEDDPDKIKVIKHHEKIVIGFAPSKIFDVVMDVGEYNQFVPYCKTSTVISKECKADIKQGEDRFMMRAQLMVYFYGYKIPYTSDVTGWKRYNENQVKAICYDQELFDHLEMDWTFSPGPTPDHCEMDFHISFAFNNTTLNWLAGYFKTKIIEQMIPAFMGQVEKIHGKPVPLPCLSQLSAQKVEAGKKTRHQRRPKH